MPSQITIITVRQFPAKDAARVGKTDTAVLYDVDGARTGRVVIPKDNPTDAEIQAAIRENEKGKHPMQGKTFTL